MRHTLYMMAAILAVALGLGTLSNLASSRRIPWIGDWDNRLEQRATESGLRLVDLAATREIVQTGTHLLFDARPAETYRAGHLPGALSLPWDEVDGLFAQYAGLLTPDTPVLVYCSGVECEESIELGTRLVQSGFTNVVLFGGGYSAWQAGEETRP